MSSFTNSVETDDNNFVIANQFFAEMEGPAPPPLRNPAPPSRPQTSKDYTAASWVREQRFNISSPSVASERDSFTGSPLPESVYSAAGFLERSSAKREKPKKREKTHFQLYEEDLAAAEEDRRKHPQNWMNVGGLWMEKSTMNVDGIDEDMLCNDGPKSKFDEIMGIFAGPRILLSKNLDVNYSIEFENRYKVDWKQFDKEDHQFVVFTKVCQAHPAGEFVEMRKEDVRCSNCHSTNLAYTARLNVPLDLSDIPIPCFDDVQVHVAFLAEHLLDQAGMDSFELMDKSCDFSKQTCERMWGRFRWMEKERKTCEEYKQWFDRCRKFVKTVLNQKTILLLHGRVVRRVDMPVGVDTRKRCAIFAQLFDLD